MLVAKINVTGTEIKSQRLVPITSGMAGATVEVTFDESWDGYTKTYVWVHGRVTKDDLNASGVIPPEVLERPSGVLVFGVYGVKGDLALPTRWVTIGSVNSGADPSGDESTDPTLPVWAQLQEQIDELRQNSIAAAGFGLPKLELTTELALSITEKELSAEDCALLDAHAGESCILQFPLYGDTEAYIRGFVNWIYAGSYVGSFAVDTPIGAISVVLSNDLGRWVRTVVVPEEA